MKFSNSNSAALVGTWEFKDKKNGPLQLIFLKNSTFHVDANSDGEKDIWGQYDIYGHWVKFTDDLPRLRTACYEPGYHYFKRTGDDLNFSYLADQCKPRTFILKQEFKKTETH